MSGDRYGNAGDVGGGDDDGGDVGGDGGDVGGDSGGNGCYDSVSGGGVNTSSEFGGECIVVETGGGGGWLLGIVMKTAGIDGNSGGDTAEGEAGAADAGGGEGEIESLWWR